MAFTGIYPAPKIEPTEFGLFAYAKPDITDENSPSGHWVRGFSQMYDTQPNYVRNWDETNSTSYVVSSNPGSSLYEEIKPIFIEVEDQRSTFNINGEDRFARVLRQIEGVSQKALEYELWNGEIALAQSLSNPFLTKQSVTVIGAGTAYSPVRGMSLLEHYAGEMSPAGEHGVIHLTRDSFFLIATNSGVFIHMTGKEHIQTASGTPVIIGSGYSGDGPHADISTIAVSGNVATVVTSGPHYMAAGESFMVATVAGDTAFEGTWTVKDVTNSTTFRFDITTGNQSATSTPGTVQMKGDDNTKWIYASGQVHAHLTHPSIVNESYAQGYDVSTNANNMKIKAQRAGVAWFDPSIHLAVKLDLTA